MSDLVIIIVIFSFMALCVAYVAWCDRIIGPSTAVEPTPATDADARPVEVRG